jgi:uncharacterized membrane protein
MNQEKKYWLDSPRNVDKLVYTLYGICALLLAADLLNYFFHFKHSAFFFEDWFGFYGIFGFIAYIFMVYSGKALRSLLTREEDYYE